MNIQNLSKDSRAAFFKLKAPSWHFLLEQIHLEMLQWSIMIIACYLLLWLNIVKKPIVLCICRILHQLVESLSHYYPILYPVIARNYYPIGRNPYYE